MPEAGGSQNAPERTGAPAWAPVAPDPLPPVGGAGWAFDVGAGRGSTAGRAACVVGTAAARVRLGATAASASGQVSAFFTTPRSTVEPATAAATGPGDCVHTVQSLSSNGLRPRRRSCDSAGNPAVTSTFFAASRSWPTTSGTVALDVAEPHPTSTAPASTTTIVARRRDIMMGTHRNRTVTLQCRRASTRGSGGRDRAGRAVGADLGPGVAHLRGVEPHRDDRVRAVPRRGGRQPVDRLLAAGLQVLRHPLELATRQRLERRADLRADVARTN